MVGLFLFAMSIQEPSGRTSPEVLLTLLSAYTQSSVA